MATRSSIPAAPRRLWRVTPISRRSRSVAFAVVVAGYLLPYCALSLDWRFPIGSTLIVGGALLAWGPEMVERCGLRAPMRQLAAAAGTLVVALPLAGYVLLDFVDRGELAVTGGVSVESGLHQWFQVLNDELVTRAMLIGIALGIVANPKVIVFGLAALFAAAHAVFYARSGTFIGFAAMGTLFAFGVVVNTLFVVFGHIWYGAALHYAWNVYRFSSGYWVDGRHLREAETFKYIEGDPWIFAGACLTILLVFGSYGRRAYPWTD